MLDNDENCKNNIILMNKFKRENAKAVVFNRELVSIPRNDVVLSVRIAIKGKQPIKGINNNNVNIVLI